MCLHSYFYCTVYVFLLATQASASPFLTGNFFSVCSLKVACFLKNCRTSFYSISLRPNYVKFAFIDDVFESGASTGRSLLQAKKGDCFVYLLFIYLFIFFWLTWLKIFQETIFFTFFFFFRRTENILGFLSI